MSIAVICIVSLLAAGLTLFSGFGLGTLLMPAFALFFPIEVAVALTAIVHLLNNFLKLFLLGRHANKEAVFKFGIPAVFAAMLGAWLLLKFQNLPAIYHYILNERQFWITPVKLIVALLMMVFVILEAHPRLKSLSFDKKYLSLGGVLSGFFGGLSGHQGALRSAFLIRAGLSKESFIATGVVIACLIDISRIGVYASHVRSENFSNNGVVLFLTVAAAFAGTFLGSKLVKKVTIDIIQKIVAIMLFITALCLAAGLI